MQAPKLIVFDVNETLLELRSLRTSVGRALNGRDELFSLWFAMVLHYSLVDTLTNDYHDFGQIGTAILSMVAEARGIESNSDEASRCIIDTIARLPAHADVIPGLRALAASGYRIVSLTYSSNKRVTAQLEFAGLTSLFERRFSVEDVRAFKPDPRTYRWVLNEIGIQPEEAMMVAAHARDLAGARDQDLWRWKSSPAPLSRILTSTLSKISPGL
ncbi:MAG: haloacid dehalogenase type II [Pseudohongiellaceae bacterium]